MFGEPRPALDQESPDPRGGRATPPRRRRRPRRGHRRSPAAAWLLFGPAALVMGLVLIYPLGRLVVNSFQNYGLRALFLGTVEWTGLDNYFKVFVDPSFWPVLLRTAGFTIALVVGVMVIGMLIGELMMHISPWVRTLLNVVLIVAWAIPVVTSTLVWQWLFQPLYGVLNYLITQLRVFGDYTSHNWTGSALSGFFIVWLLIVWQSIPFVAFTLYAGRSQIPEDYFEAAALDGASGFKIYRLITLPFLRPVLYLVVILELIWQFNAFTQLWILTRGGPSGSTTTLSIWSFQTAFASNSFGVGSAIAVVTTVLLILITAGYIRRLIKQGEAL